MITSFRGKRALVTAAFAVMAAIAFYLIASQVSTRSEIATAAPLGGEALAPQETFIRLPSADVTFDRHIQAPLASSATSPMILVDERQREIHAAIARLLEEDLLRMGEVLQLSIVQHRLVRDALIKVRMSPTVEIGGENSALRRILTPQQFELWDAEVERQGREEAENYASTRVRGIGRIIFDLTEDQKDAIFAGMAGTVLGPSSPDDQILSKILTPDQFIRWTESSDSKPERLE